MYKTKRGNISNKVGSRGKPDLIFGVDSTVHEEKNTQKQQNQKYRY